ncbi:unnamed protein product [Mortierella alpina]
MADSNYNSDSSAPPVVPRATRPRGDSQSYSNLGAAHMRTPSSHSFTQSQAPTSPRSQRSTGSDLRGVGRPHPESPSNLVHTRDRSMSSGRVTQDETEGRALERMNRSPSSGPEVGVEGQQENSGTQSSGRNSLTQNRYSQQQQQVQYAQEIIRHSMILQPPTQPQPSSQDPLRSSIIQQQPQAQPYPYDPRRQSVQSQHPLQHTSQRDSRMSSYQATPQMQSTRPPSIGFSEPPGSPLPPYVARPAQAMKPPHYYQEIHHETQAAGQMEYMDATDERRGYNSGDALWMPGNRSSNRQAEEDIYQSAGQFNPEASSRSRKKSSDGSRRAECWSTLRDIAEFCPCLCVCCICGGVAMS